MAAEDSEHIATKIVADLLLLTLKVIILINGAAAVAILTLIGSILTSNVKLDSVILFLTMAISAFGFGVLSGAIAIGMGYRSEYFSGKSVRSIHRITVKNLPDETREALALSGIEDSDSSKKYLNYALVFACSSFTLFGIGIVLCALAFLS